MHLSQEAEEALLGRGLSRALHAGLVVVERQGFVKDKTGSALAHEGPVLVEVIITSFLHESFDVGAAGLMKDTAALSLVIKFLGATSGDLVQTLRFINILNFRISIEKLATN